MSASGGCEAARTRCGWVRFRECGELQHGKKFPLKLKGAVYRSYVWPAILYGSEAWCLKESEIGILQRTERSPWWEQCVEYSSKIKKDIWIWCSCWVWNHRSVGYGKQFSLVWSCIEDGEILIHLESLVDYLFIIYLLLFIYYWYYWVFL